MGHGSSMEEKSVTADIVSRRSVKEEASNLYHHPFSSPTSLIGWFYSLSLSRANHASHPRKTLLLSIVMLVTSYDRHMYSVREIYDTVTVSYVHVGGNLQAGYCWQSRSFNLPYPYSILLHTCGNWKKIWDTSSKFVLLCGYKNTRYRRAYAPPSPFCTNGQSMFVWRVWLALLQPPPPDNKREYIRIH